MTAKSRISWEIPRNTLILPISIQKGDINVKSINVVIIGALFVVVQCSSSCYSHLVAIDHLVVVVVSVLFVVVVVDSYRYSTARMDNKAAYTA